MTTNLQMKLFAEDPVFIFDRDDAVNMPDTVFQKDTILLWEKAPAFVKEIFWRAFGKDAIINPYHRPTERDFFNVLKEFMCVLK